MVSLRLQGLPALIAFALAPTVSESQWVSIVPPGVPRTTSGQPDLRAPAPRTVDGHVDLSGVWTAVVDGGEAPPPALNLPRNRHTGNIGVDIPGGVPLTPWATALQVARRQRGEQIPTTRCLPSGIPPDMLRPSLPFKIIQTPGVTLMLFEEFGHWRQVLTDGRPLPSVTIPGSFGYSVGRWEQDTFVVDTIGMSEQTWLDGRGTPHSEELHLTERFRRHDFGRMEIEWTFDDPTAFTKIWSARVDFDLQPDYELMDSRCEPKQDLDVR